MYLKIMKDYKEDDIEDFKLNSNTNDQAVIINSYKYAKIYWKTTAPYSVGKLRIVWINVSEKVLLTIK